ncbi:MAG TPA: DUF4340 domain-containing protein [Candidatus Acidoferrum sp.]|nr:DUF4340 domain-containing protein [Candidatus Acidoferrum sp.]
MRWQTSVVLAVLLAAAGVFYYVYDVRMAPEREKAEGRKGRVFNAETQDVTQLTLKRPGDTIELKREGDGWQMSSPLRARADRGPVEEVITNALTSKIDREIAAAPTSPAEFGLDKPAAELTLTLKDGKSLGLLLGAKSPTGVWVYAQERGKPSVFVIGDSVLRDATRPVGDFRDKSILAFDRQQVTGLEIVTREDTIALEPADHRWKITRPVALGADADTVSGFLEKLGGAKVKEFVAEAPPSLATYGLDKPWRVTLVTGKDKDRASRALLIGNAETGKGVYAMRDGESSVLLIPEDVWTALPKNVAALRDKSVVQFDRDKVSRLDVESPQGPITLARENDKWKLTAPQALPADQVEAGALLTKLQNLRAQGFLGEDATLIPKFLAKPEVKVTVTDAGGAKTLLLAPSPEKRGGQAMAYGALAGRGPVVLVDGAALKDFARSVNELRDRTLLSGLEPKDVKRMQVTAGGKTTMLERSGETDWRVIEPAKGAAKSSQVDDLLYTLRGLKWKDLVAPGGEDPAKYGLDKPGVEVRLFRADGTEIGSVLFGKQDGERLYLKTRNAPAIYAADPKQVGALPKSIDAFKG